MDLKLLKPLYLDGVVWVVDKPYPASEQHGRELVRKGYAREWSETEGAGGTADPAVEVDQKALELENLRARAGDLGISNAGRLGEAKLRERIKAAEKEASGQPEAETDKETDDSSEDGETESEEKAAE